MSHVSDTMRNGAAFYARAAQSDGGELGFPLPKIAFYEYGAITTLTTTGICVAATGVANGGALSATGSLVTAGVATFDVPRCVSLTSTGNNSTLSFTVTGTDQYGAAQTETVTGPNNATVNSVKAFKTVTSVVSSTSIVGTVSVGNSDTIGLPYHLLNKGRLIGGAMVDGLAVAATIVAGFTATGTSTATTADVRGTITSTVTNGTKLFSVMMVVNPTSKVTLYGADPA